MTTIIYRHTIELDDGREIELVFEIAAAVLRNSEGQYRTEIENVALVNALYQDGDKALPVGSAPARNWFAQQLETDANLRRRVDERLEQAEYTERNLTLNL